MDRIVRKNYLLSHENRSKEKIKKLTYRNAAVDIDVDIDIDCQSPLSSDNDSTSKNTSNESYCSHHNYYFYYFENRYSALNDD